MDNEKTYPNHNERPKFEERTTEITLEELKGLDSFKEYDEAQAEQLIQTMKAFARIVYHIVAREEQEQQPPPDNGKIIEVNSVNHKNKAA